MTKLAPDEQIRFQLVLTPVELQRGKNFGTQNTWQRRLTLTS